MKLKSFAKINLFLEVIGKYENNFHIIKLDEMVKTFEKDDFYDKIHTGINGSKKISELLYPELKEILINY